MAELKVNSKVKLEYGGEVKVLKELGRGGQGIVYLVEYEGKNYALKWYFHSKLKQPEDFKNNLRRNINDKSPSDKFLWPKYVTEGIQSGSFGYLMDLIPSNYVEFSDVLNTYSIKVVDKKPVKKDVRFEHLQPLVNAAINIVVAFRDLHRKGKSYQDLNDGGFYIDLNTGDVLICDCDNIAPDGENFGIAGLPGYMAPEIVKGVAKPSVQTDKYSLAVVLFKLFFRHDPLEGAKVLKSVCLHEGADLIHYGKDPVFIFDPVRKDNRPLKGSQVIALWSTYPKYVRDTFIKAFTAGIENPNHRVIENEWQKLLVRLRSEIIVCKCGRERYTTGYKYNNGEYICPSCSSKFLNLQFNTGDIEIPLFTGQKLYKCFTAKRNNDFETATASIIENKKHPGVLGIKNISDKEWTCSLNGKSKVVKSNEIMVLKPGMTISFDEDVIARVN